MVEKKLDNIRVLDTDIPPLAERRDFLLSQIQEAAQISLRSADDIELMAVSKTVETTAVLAASQVGYKVFGENRPQELIKKIKEVNEIQPNANLTFDLIGQLQRNKINSILGQARLIHSVDSLKLAQGISERAQRLGLIQHILLEVNVSGEKSKTGFSAEDIIKSIEAIEKLEGILIRGLMTMAPQGDLSVARKTFEACRELRDKLQEVGDFGDQLSELSMGMSEDFAVAIAEGATIIRIGRKVFDPLF